jgi:hypothetical protein
MSTELDLTTVATLAAGGSLTLIGLWIGSFVRPYLAKKGENLATHEDIDNLVDQVRAVTATTKKIEAEISVGVWDKQKRWDMKREVLFEAARRLSEVEAALLSYWSTMAVNKVKQRDWATTAPTPAETLPWKATMTETLKKWGQTSTAFDETRMFVGIVCGREAIDAFEDLGQFVNALVVQCREDPDAYNNPDLERKVLAARNAIRKELEVDT